MLSNKSNKELVAAGHKFAANISADTPLIDMAKMVSELATQLDVALAAAAEACKQRDAVATENAALKKSLITIANSERFDGDSFVCDFDSLVSVAAGALSTPATDAYLNSVRAEIIPEGYILVPQQMHISADAMESICFHGGDGDGQFGEFTDVILWVGHIENDDGTKTYGLNITTAEYPEDGSANISEFAEPIGSGTHDTADKEAK